MSSCSLVGWQAEAELTIVDHGVWEGGWTRRVVSTPIPYAASMFCATPVSLNQSPAE